MRTRRLAIEDPLRAEDIRDGSIHRRGELSRPLASRSDPVQVFFFDFLRILDLLLLFRRWLGELAFNTELDFNFRILGARDNELVAERKFCAGRFASFRFTS